MKSLCALIVLSMTIALNPQSAYAWGSDVHTSLIQFTGNIQYVPGVMESNPRYVLPSDMAHVCNKQRQRLRPNSAYYDLLCGADEPDAKRKWFHALSHQADSEKRARRAFSCSVYNRFGLSGKNWPDWKAARQLGHSIHYLQDIADPSKRTGRHKGAIRTRARLVLQAALNAASGSFPQIPFVLRRRIERASLRMSGLRSPKEIVNRARQVQRDHAHRLVSAYEALNNAPEGGRYYADLAFNKAVLDVLAETIALQDRWVDLYTTGLGRASRNLDYWRSACRGRQTPITQPDQPNTPACARPPAVVPLITGQKYYIAVRSYGPGIKCLTPGQASKERNQPNVTSFKALNKQCTICPRGYGVAPYQGVNACVQCPQGTRYQDGCCR